jgi:hypothetical protein
MNNMSTNALIANLRALSREIHRAERRLNESDLDDDVSEELGHYANDLNEALAAMTCVYEERRRNDDSLTPAERLLSYFIESADD